MEGQILCIVCSWCASRSDELCVFDACGEISAAVVVSQSVAVRVLSASKQVWCAVCIIRGLDIASLVAISNCYWFSIESWWQALHLWGGWSKRIVVDSAAIVGVSCSVEWSTVILSCAICNAGEAWWEDHDLLIILSNSEVATVQWSWSAILIEHCQLVHIGCISGLLIVNHAAFGWFTGLVAVLINRAYGVLGDNSWGEKEGCETNLVH